MENPFLPAGAVFSSLLEQSPLPFRRAAPSGVVRDGLFGYFLRDRASAVLYLNRRRDARTAALGRLMFVHRCERLVAPEWVYL
jgi:hypothetical protein